MGLSVVRKPGKPGIECAREHVVDVKEENRDADARRCEMRRARSPNTKKGETSVSEIAPHP